MYVNVQQIRSRQKPYKRYIHRKCIYHDTPATPLAQHIETRSHSRHCFAHGLCWMILVEVFRSAKWHWDQS